MVNSYDDMQGTEIRHPDTESHNFQDRVQLAGTVLDKSSSFSGLQMLNRMMQTISKESGVKRESEKNGPATIIQLPKIVDPRKE